MSDHTARPGGGGPVAFVQLPAGWYPDPLGADLLRFNDGARWTFWTSTPDEHGQANATSADQPAVPDTDVGPTGHNAYREDIADAMEQAAPATGARKEFRLLPKHLRDGEVVQAAATGLGDGFGAFAVTNQRILFSFEGMVRTQFVSLGLDTIVDVIYVESTKKLEVYNVRRTKRATPVLDIAVVGNIAEGHRILEAVRRVLVKPRMQAH